MNIVTKDQLNRAFFLAITRSYFNEIKEKTPGKGFVRDGWEIEMKGIDIIMSNKKFGDIILYLEDGVDPHIIEAKNKKFLKFKKPTTVRSKHSPIRGNIAFEKDGFIYSKKVMHPGIVARKFIYNILTDPNTNKRFETEFEKEIKKIF